MVARTAIIVLILILGVIFFIKENNQENHTSPHSDSLTLVDPEMAPAEIRSAVMQGFKIMMQTAKYLPDNAGDRISCSNCHFSAGNTLGGVNNGISLVGVTRVYPKMQENGQPYTLAERINACFEKSLNGKPLAEDSKSMKSLITYFDWISSPVANLPKKHLSWLGLPPIRSKHIPNPEQGALVYVTNCAMCHGKEGEGQQRNEDLSYPPLWGEFAFNSAAGMNKVSTLASFVYHNMPYEEPDLTIEEALDVAAFIHSQPRPIKKNEKFDFIN